MRRPVVWIIGLVVVAAPAARADDERFVRDEPWFPVAARPGPTLTAGTDLLYVRPYLTNDRAFDLVRPAAGTAQSTTFTWAHTRAHRFWVECAEPSGWGARFGTFVFDDGSERPDVTLVNEGIATQRVVIPPVGPAVPGVAGFAGPSAVLVAAGLGEDRMTFQSDLRIVTVDVEATFGCVTTDWALRLSGGGRYLMLRHGYRADLMNPGNGLVSESQALAFIREFTGGGPTLALFARHRIGDSALSAYASARGSVLFGTLDERSAFARTVSEPGSLAGVGTQSVRASAVHSANHTVPASELELGVEYGGRLGWLRLFGRAGVVAQTYFNAGSATSSGGSLTLFGALVTVGFGF